MYFEPTSNHDLLLNEKAFKNVDEAKRPAYLFKWLRYIDRQIPSTDPAKLVEIQKQLVAKLIEILQDSPGPPIRKLVSKCLCSIFNVGDTLLLFDTVNQFHDILKNKDDSPSFIQIKLGVIRCLGCMYEKLGRMMGRLFEDTLQITLKILRNSESIVRIEVMLALEKMCRGLGPVLSSLHKEIYKTARHCLNDRVMAVRIATVKCLREMSKYAKFLHTSELENMSSLCFRAFEGSNYEARYSIASFLASQFVETQAPSSSKVTSANGLAKASKEVSLDEVFSILSTGFSRGGTGFLKGPGEIIKGSSSVNRDIRVGVTHTWSIFLTSMGPVWLEKNMSSVLKHVFDLFSNAKTASASLSHIDTIYSQKCVRYILHSSIGRLLGEKAQTTACKELAAIISKHVSTSENGAEQDTIPGQQVIMCALQEMGLLTITLGTAFQNVISDHSCDLIETVFSVLVHPNQATRLSAAWCIRCICVAVPGQCTPLIDRCVRHLDNMKTCSDVISGYSAALAAILGAVKCSTLGIPHNKGKMIFNAAEELLRSASQHSRLSLQRTQAGWLLVAAVTTLGPSVVRSLLPKLLLLWRNSFPKSSKEFDSEKARGDAFTWQVTLEGRAGAINSMRTFLQNCQGIVTDDLIRRLLNPIESAITMMINLGPILKMYGQQIKAPATMVRNRIFETLKYIPAHSLDGLYTQILRLVVSDFTLNDNVANTSCSLARSISQIADDVLLSLSAYHNADHAVIEEQLQSSGVIGCGALENDSSSLFEPIKGDDSIPEPLPLGVSVVDSSVTLFGIIFPRVSSKNRLHIINHLAESIKLAKSSRSETISINVFSALLVAIRALVDAKSSIGAEDVQKATTTLISAGLNSPNALLRILASECLGKLAQAVGDPIFTAELVQNSFDRLKTARDVATRTGYSLAVGCIHRLVGGFSSSQHLNTSISILLALAQDNTSPIVQAWSLYSMSMIAESGGAIFRGYVVPTLSTALRLLLFTPENHIEVHRCIGRLVIAIVTTIGPELALCPDSLASIDLASSLLRQHPNPLVQAESIKCVQNTLLFAPHSRDLTTFVPSLCKAIFNKNQVLRKAALSCIRQLCQRETKKVCELAQLCGIGNENEDEEEADISLPDAGLPGWLFGMLDTENDNELILDIHMTLSTMLQALASENLQEWLALCKSVLTVASENNQECNWANSDSNVMVENMVEQEQEDDDDDNAQLGASGEDELNWKMQPRWRTRVFAADCLCRIVSACGDANPKHYNPEQRQLINRDSLVSHLSDLIRMAFMAATSDCDQLKLEGLKILRLIIEKFSTVPEPEFPGHLLLEQFQAQVGAALRPAFATETTSQVTAAACDVCSAWIGSGVAKDMNDLKRIHQLLVSSLKKLHQPTLQSTLYNESLQTLERLSILKAWAEVYVVAMTNGGYVSFGNNNANITRSPSSSGKEEFSDLGESGDSLLSLVKPELSLLGDLWIAALRDHALLSLPSEFSCQLPREGGTFYSSDTSDGSRLHYAATWPPLLLAANLWLTMNEFKQVKLHTNQTTPPEKSDKFGLLFGICMEWLSSSRISYSTDCLLTCLRSMYLLLDSPYPRFLMMTSPTLAVEVANVLHRLTLTMDNVEVQKLTLDVLTQTIKAADEHLQLKKNDKLCELFPENQEIPTEAIDDLDVLGEGGEDGQIIMGKGLVFSALEVCLCVLVRQLPALNPDPQKSAFVRSASNEISTADSHKLIASAISVLQTLPDLCSPRGAISILPTILYLTTSAMKEVAIQSNEEPAHLNEVVKCAINSLRTLATHRYSLASDKWISLLQSTLAKLVDNSKIGLDEARMDRTSIMIALSVFVLYAPPEVGQPPNLQYPCINYFGQCFQSDNIRTRIMCVQTLRRIFHRPEKCVASGYIVAISPRLIEYLYSENSFNVTSESELSLTIEVATTIESLVQLADPEKGVKVLEMLVPALVNYLLNELSFPNANKYQQSLHNHSLGWLTKIGSKYRQEFKNIMGQENELRSKLEDAIRLRKSEKNQSQAEVAKEFTKSPVESAPPTIKLKTDFTNFNN